MKKISSKILGGLVILAFLVNINITVFSADNTTSLQNSKKNNNQKITEAQNNLNEVKAEKSETQKQVETISSKIDEYENQISKLDNEINEKIKQIEESENKINEIKDQISEKQKLLDARMLVSYEAGETSYLDVMLSSQSITDLISNYFLITEVATYDTDLLNTIEQEKKEVEQEKENLETTKSQLDSSKASKESVTVQLNNTKSEKNKYVAQLSAEERNIQDEIDDLKQANVQIDKNIAAAQAQYAAQLAALKAKKAASNESSGGNASSGTASAGTSTSGISSSGFIRPVNSYVTTGWYYSSGALHGAVDFGAYGVNGMPVFAVADGVVITAVAQTSSYGNYIIIAHPNGLYTLYAHGQSGSIRVSPGQTVSQGQQIMNVGSTGNSTGPHLHFEVRVSPGGYSNRVNPLGYLP